MTAINGPMYLSVLVSARAGAPAAVAGGPFLASATYAGGPGNDILWGGANSDKLFGDAGNDDLFGGGGTAGFSADTYRYDAGEWTLLDASGPVAPASEIVRR